MPIFNTQLSGKGKQPDGTEIDVPGSFILQQRGPVLQITLEFPDVLAEELRKNGSQVPAPATGLALIDTGATITCVDDTAARTLGLPVIDTAMMGSASHVATQTNVYPALITILGSQIRITAARAIGASLANQGIIALIGRDLLQHCTLYYNGTTGSFTLSM